MVQSDVCPSISPHDVIPKNSTTQHCRQLTAAWHHSWANTSEHVWHWLHPILDIIGYQNLDKSIVPGVPMQPAYVSVYLYEGWHTCLASRPALNYICRRWSAGRSDVCSGWPWWLVVSSNCGALGSTDEDVELRCTNVDCQKHCWCYSTWQQVSVSFGFLTLSTNHTNLSTATWICIFVW